MSHWPRGRDRHGVVHYVHENQGVRRTRDPWCLRQDGFENFGACEGVGRVPPSTPVTCILCVAIRARR